MKNRNKFILIAILFALIVYGYRNIFTDDMIVGTYVNTNFENAPVIAELPNKADTLVLYRDSKFKSSHWGTGTFKLAHSLSGTKIKLRYQYIYGIAGVSAKIERLNWRQLVIILNEDFNQYYRKID